MEFGFCYIPDYHPEVHGPYADWYARLLREWRAMDTLGFDAVWLAEHRLSGYGFSSLPVVAQALASATTKLRIGTAVSLISQRHPILSAEDWAAVDQLSGGRLRLGVGRGIYAYDFEVLEIDSAESRERFEEALDIITRLWTEDCVTHHGRFWNFEGHTLGPKPLQQPRPPIYVACVASPESYELAGRLGYNILVSPFLLDSHDRQRDYIARYRAALAASGHGPGQVLANYHLALVPDDAPLGDEDRYFYAYLDFVHRTNNPRKLNASGYSGYQRGGGLYSDVADMRQNRTIFGTPGQCVDRIASLSEAVGGLDGWMFHINYGGVPEERVMAQLHLLREEVMPAFGRPATAL